MSKEKLFGTDGIRGEAGKYPLDGKTLFALGVCVAKEFGVGASPLRPLGEASVLVGWDTRESSEEIFKNLADGITAGGGKVSAAGVAPTPAVAYLTREKGFDAGIVISASHNPYRDNGIKIFGKDGFKISEKTESAIETNIKSATDFSADGRSRGARIERCEHLNSEYFSFLKSQFKAKVPSGTRIVIDCANGAASEIAPKLFKNLGFEVKAISHSPDGRNINNECGALFPKKTAEAVKETGAALGVSFDGDADRAMFAGASGRIFDGDDILLLFAGKFPQTFSAHKRHIVGTVMTNCALENSLRSLNIALTRADVGDKYVLGEMRKTGAPLGGEPSGHIIFLDCATTGDGLLTAVKTANLLFGEGVTLDGALADFKKYPQIIENVRVLKKPPIETLPSVMKEIENAEKLLDGEGRVVVRYSGTEPKARIMVEGSSESAVKDLANSIARAFEKELAG